MSLSKMLQEYREGLRGLPTYEELAAIASHEPCADPIVERNVSLLRQRSTVGVQKYGTTLADNKLPLRAWLNHALEEALDQANYLQAAMAEIDSAERALPPLPQYFPDVTNIRADEELRAQQYATGYARTALQSIPMQKDTSENAPWLTLAHIICADAGVPPGHISDRLKALRDKLEAPEQASNPVEFDGIKTATVQAQEPFMFGIMGPDGKAHMDEHCVAPDAASLYDELNGLNDSPDTGYSIVPLFRAPVQPVAVPDDLDMQTIRERDYNAEMADKLAEAISKNFGVDIGEHSNMNCPWHEALQAIENAKPVMWAALNMNGKAVCVNQDKSACDIERLCIKTPTTIVPLYAGASEPQ